MIEELGNSCSDIDLQEKINCFRPSFFPRSSLTLDTNLVIFVPLRSFYCTQNLHGFLSAKLFETSNLRTASITQHFPAVVRNLEY